MIKKLRLKNFKNFEEAELILGPFTVLFGTNASGKSNLRDAFRFLQGIGLRYTLADIFGGRYEGGTLQWRGMRGGTLEATYQKRSSFVLEAEFDFDNGAQPGKLVYSIEVEPGHLLSVRPRVIRESLYHNRTMLFDSYLPGKPVTQDDAQHLVVRVPPGEKRRRDRLEKFIANQPVLSQIEDRLDERKDQAALEIKRLVRSAIGTLASMRFLELNPDAMRLPSIPGQINLGDRGENLSSVLQAICENPHRNSALTDWIKELTPMDASDFKFSADQTGKILVTLVEESGQTTSAYSASDGTLRFLGVIAALLGPAPARFYFFEELENGIYPTRLPLLMDLIERTGVRHNIQVVATTHSPQLLRLLSPQSLQAVSLTYRLPGKPDARLRRILDLPTEAAEVIQHKDLARLLESGWFEDVVDFTEPVE